MKRIFKAYRDSVCMYEPFCDMSKTAKNVYGLISFILALPAIVLSWIASVCLYVRLAIRQNKENSEVYSNELYEYKKREP